MLLAAYLRKPSNIRKKQKPLQHKVKQWLYLCNEESQTGTTHKVNTKLVLILSQHDAVEVAADKVSKNDAAVDAEDFPEMEFPE